MGDSGEGLVDANAKIDERIEETQENRRMAQKAGSSPDPENIRAVETLRLTKIDLERQLSATVHEARRQYLLNVLAEIDRRISVLQTHA